MSDAATDAFVSGLRQARLDAEKRLGRKLSAGYLAKLLGVSDKSVYAYFNGTTVPENLLFDRLLQAMDITGAQRGDLATRRDAAERSRRAGARRTVPPPTVPPPTVPPRSVVPRELPRFPGAFIEREGALRELDGVLSAAGGGASPTVVTISGSAGVGKTTIAVAWAHRVSQHFPDGQIFVDLRGFDETAAAVPPAQALRRFIGSLGVEPAGLPSGVDELAGRFRSMLAGRRVLLLLDNAYDSHQVQPLIPGTPGCLVLVTSRNQLGGLVTREHARPIVLGVMDEPEATALIGACLGADRTAAQPAVIAELVRYCAGLPLALAIAASRAALSPQLPLDGLVAELRSDTGRLHALNAGEAGADVEAVFSLSYRRLSGPAARLFRLLGLHPGWDIGAPAAAALADVTVDAVQESLSELVRTNLLEEHATGRFTRHDLLRVYAATLVRSSAPDERCGAVVRLLSWYLHTAAEAGRAIDPERRRRPLLDAPYRGPRLEFHDHEDAIAWCEQERANLIAATHLAVDHGHDRIAWQLPLALVDYFDRRKHWADWIAINRVALVAADRDGDTFARATTRNSLGVVSRELGRLDEALRYYEEALDIFRDSDDRYATAMLLTNLGNITTQLERYDVAVDYHERAVALFVSAGSRYGQALAMENLGRAYARTGRLDDAVDQQERALDICRDIHDLAGEAATLDSLGETFRAVGRTREAIDRFRAALPIRRAIGDRYGELITLVNLGDALHDPGHQDEAHALWHEAVSIARDIGDPQAERIQARIDGCAGWR